MKKMTIVKNTPGPSPETDKYYQSGLRARRYADGIMEIFKPALVIIAGLVTIALVTGYMVLTIIVLAAAPWAGLVLLLIGGVVVKAIFR